MFIASASDIDDLVPIVTAYQLEWNKVRARLVSAHLTGPFEELVRWMVEDASLDR